MGDLGTGGVWRAVFFKPLLDLDGAHALAWRVGCGTKVRQLEYRVLRLGSGLLAWLCTEGIGGQELNEKGFDVDPWKVYIPHMCN